MEFNTMQEMLDKTPDYFKEHQAEVKTFGEAVKIASMYAEGNRDVVDTFLVGETLAHISDDGFLVLDDKINGIQEAWISPNALSQMVSRANDNDATELRLAYIKNCPPYLAAQNLNHWMKGLETTMRFMVIGGAAQAVLRACVSDKWQRAVDNAPVLRALGALEYSRGPIIPEDTPLYGGSWVSGNGINLAIPMQGGEFELPDLPNGGSSYYRAGISITGDETGGGALKIAFFIQRNACQNSIRFIDSVPTQYWTHSGRLKTAEGVAREMAEMMLRTIFKESDALVGNLIQSIERHALERLNDDQVLEELGGFIQAYNLSDDNAARLNRISGEYAPTKLGVANAVTQFSQMLEDAALAHRMEQSAGEYMISGNLRARRATVEVA